MVSGFGVDWGGPNPVQVMVCVKVAQHGSQKTFCGDSLLSDGDSSRLEAEQRLVNAYKLGDPNNRSVVETGPRYAVQSRPYRRGFEAYTGGSEVCIAVARRGQLRHWVCGASWFGRDEPLATATYADSYADAERAAKSWIQSSGYVYDFIHEPFSTWASETREQKWFYRLKRWLTSF